MIRLLPREVIKRIAAGEVIARPADVVKELVENSIDADATSVHIELKHGGLDFLQVSDDGTGIHPQDLPLAVRRHATSKIADITDLDRITTFGFRGEALAAIAVAAGRLQIVTAVDGAASAFALTVEGGLIESPSVRPAARAKGTTVNVEHLFAHLPARRRFLASPSKERAACVREAAMLALACPTVRLRLVADGQTVLDFPAHSLPERAAAVWKEPPESLCCIPPTELFGNARVSIVFGRPPLSRRFRSATRIIVNSRPVETDNFELENSVIKALKDKLPTGNFPLAAVWLELPPDAIDVHIHPAKRCVRLKQSRQLAEALETLLVESFGATIRRSYNTSSPLVNTQTLTAPGSDDKSSARRDCDSQHLPLHPCHSRVENSNAPRATLVGYQVSVSDGVLPTSPWQYLGQLACTYLLLEDAHNNLFIVDQHAAHERVLLEELQNSDADIARQPLMEPLVVHIDRQYLPVLEDHTGVFRELGCEIEPFGLDAVLVRAIPMSGHVRSPETLVRHLLALGQGASPADLRRQALATIACHSAVRAGDTMSKPKAIALLSRLASTRWPFACAHGRPTIIRATCAELGRLFRRC